MDPYLFEANEKEIEEAELYLEKWIKDPEPLIGDDEVIHLFGDLTESDLSTESPVPSPSPPSSPSAIIETNEDSKDEEKDLGIVNVGNKIDVNVLADRFDRRDTTKFYFKRKMIEEKRATKKRRIR
uniref:Uncharacterized protein n=1 Tax=Panagrolaimus sp. ES5 TaxID=591445 RepID=A0AC34FHC1_9BILA